MKRKTNLFYNTNEDTNFITFSNHTESMTGNYLSTNTKIFPSKFLCLYVPKLSESENIAEERLKFIRTYLCGMYENKLAALRDYCTTNNKNCEDYIKPLNYLLDAIYKYDNTFTINYIGEVTEQDYNGIYADTICVVTISNIKCGTITYNTNSLTGEALTITENVNSLWGWEHTELPSLYSDITPIYDNNISDTSEGQYYFNSNVKDITEKTIVHPKSVRFNVIIPLFDTVNINYKENISIIKEEDTISLEDNSSELYYKNVPMGMWFATRNVVLYNTTSANNYSPSWSLVLSSQFKPFPYSKNIPDEITNDSISNAYQTFSELLIKQNELIDKFDDVLTTLSAFSSRLSNVEGKFSTLGCSYSMDNMQLELLRWEKNMENRFTDLNNNVNSYLSELKWRFRQR